MFDEETWEHDTAVALLAITGVLISAAAVILYGYVWMTYAPVLDKILNTVGIWLGSIVSYCLIVAGYTNFFLTEEDQHTTHGGGQ